MAEFTGDTFGGESDIGQDSSSTIQPFPQSISDTGNYWNEIIFSIIVIAVSIAVYYIIRYFLNKMSDSLQLERGQLKGIYSITKLAIVVTAIIIIIFQFSSTGGVTAGAISVAVGTVIGFSSRNTISNAIAGILLLSSRPFRIGDRIQASTDEQEGLVGDVIEITVLYTKLKTIRNELVAIPNQLLLQQQIINYSGLDTLACSIEVGLSYAHNRKAVEALLLEAATHTMKIIKEPHPFVLIKKLDSYGAIYELRAYTNRPNEFFNIQSDMRKNVYDLFQLHGQDLTVPQAQTDIEHREKHPDINLDKESLT